MLLTLLKLDLIINLVISSILFRTKILGIIMEAEVAMVEVIHKVRGEVIGIIIGMVMVCKLETIKEEDHSKLETIKEEDHSKLETIKEEVMLEMEGMLVAMAMVTLPGMVEVLIMARTSLIQILPLSLAKSALNQGILQLSAETGLTEILFPFIQPLATIQLSLKHQEQLFSQPLKEKWLIKAGTLTVGQPTISPTICKI